MTFVDVPIRADLKLHYILNPTTDTDEPESQPFDPEKPTIVFVHASAGSCRSFAAQMRDARLSNAYNLLFMDARLHGETVGGDRATHTLMNSAECLVASLDVLRIPSYAIFGEGVHGATTAVNMAVLKGNDVVRGLVLASPGYMVEEASIRHNLLTLRDMMLENKDGQGDGSGAIEEECLTIAADYFVGGAERLRDRRNGLKAWLQYRYGTGRPGHDIRHIMNSTTMRQPPSPKQLASITCPVVILHGTEDTAVSPLKACEEWKQALVGARGGAQIVEITGAPHLLSLSDYSIVNRILFQFMARRCAQ